MLSDALHAKERLDRFFYGLFSLCLAAKLYRFESRRMAMLYMEHNISHNCTPACKIKTLCFWNNTSCYEFLFLSEIDFQGYVT